MTRAFQRFKEDFECRRCGARVEGDGYTNHCPRCLWSRHVDVAPGDRQGLCRGMMEPIAVERKKGEHRILHRCTRCGFERSNRRAPNDDFEAFLAISVRPRSARQER